MLHWASLLMAVALITTAGVILTQTSKLNDSFVITVVVGLAAGGVIVWLIGKALQYILTGPSGALFEHQRSPRPNVFSKASVSTHRWHQVSLATLGFPEGHLTDNTVIPA